MARLRVRGKQPKDEVRPPKPDKTIQTLTYATNTATNIIKGINKANEAKLLEKGYLEGGKYQVSVDAGGGQTTNANIWQRSGNIKPGARPINRVQLSTTGKQHLQHLATENRTTFEHELTKLMQNEGAPPEEILNQINKNVELTSTYDATLSAESQQLTIEQMNNRFEMLETAKANEITASENFLQNAKDSGQTIDADLTQKITNHIETLKTPTDTSAVTPKELAVAKAPKLTASEIQNIENLNLPEYGTGEIALDPIKGETYKQTINPADSTFQYESINPDTLYHQGPKIDPATNKIIPDEYLQRSSLEHKKWSYEPGDYNELMKQPGSESYASSGSHIDGVPTDIVHSQSGINQSALDGTAHIEQWITDPVAQEAITAGTDQIVQQEVLQKSTEEIGKKLLVEGGEEIITQEIGKEVALNASQKAIENQISQELVKTGVQTGANAAANAAFMAVAGPIGWTMFALQMADTIMKMDEGKEQQEELEEEQDIYKQLA